MGNKVQYFLICGLAVLVVSACIHSDSIEAAEIGDTVQNMSWTTISGEQIDLQNFRGSWVLLCYLQSYPDHADDILAIQDICNNLDEKNFKVVVILSNNDKAASKDFAGVNISPLYFVIDRHNSISRFKFDKYQENIWPVYFLVDTDGNLSKAHYEEFYDNPLIPPTHLPLNDAEVGQEVVYAYISRNNIRLNEYQWRVLNILIFLKNAIRHIPHVDFSDVTVTNITSHEVTIKWRTNMATRSWVEIIPKNGERYIGRCSIPTKQGTNHETTLDCIPNTTYIFTIATGDWTYEQVINGFDTNMFNRSKEYSFTTLPDNQND